MCELCQEETHAQAVRGFKRKAQQLRDLARDLDMLANGEVKPHMDYVKNTLSVRARNVIQELVVDWL